MVTMRHDVCCRLPNMCKPAREHENVMIGIILAAVNVLSPSLAKCNDNDNI